MNASDILLLWSNDPGISFAVWLFVTVLALYLGRSAAHKAILTVSRAARSFFRMTARSVARLADRLTERNKEVILNAGADATERAIEREFQRVKTIVERDLSAYPAVHRKISDAIKKIEDDYKNATETPPSPPAWIQAVTAIGSLPREGDSAVEQILNEIYELVEKSHKQTMAEFSKSSLRRLDLLRRMMPTWRNLSRAVNQIKGNVEGITQRAAFIDQQMKKYEQIRAREDRIARVLTSSSLTQFFISAIVLTIAVFGGLVNFQLIALPMSEMVGGTSYLGVMRMADVAALVIIMLEVAMGLFLLDSLRITRLFPVIGSMDDQMRRRMFVITLVLLFVLASIEASLAYMRDLLALDREALAQSLAGVTAENAEFRWIPSIGQMILGFILPFTLAFVAIPLESFIHSLRTVLGVIGVGTLRSAACLARICGNGTGQMGKVLVNLYDFAIFLPLAVEKAVQKKAPHKAGVDGDSPLFQTVDSEKGV